MELELAKYRVKIAAEVELGADDNLVEGTEVTVEAFSPALAMIVALQRAITPLAEQLDCSQEDVMRMMAHELGGLSKQLMGMFAGVIDEQEGETIPDASAPLPVMPLCGCGHRYDHHDHDPTSNVGCHIEDCPCASFKAAGE